jgi:hypothetical protein
MTLQGGHEFQVSVHSYNHLWVAAQTVKFLKHEIDT